MSEIGDWRFVYASVAGVAHLANDVECQDACTVRWVSMLEAGPVLILTVADGAGSASQPRAGAELACQTLLSECMTRLLAVSSTDWTPALAEVLLENVRAALEERAADAGLPMREFACTLLGAVVTADRALCLQIGDGAIVIGAQDRYWPVFWPQTGVYANETHFVTDPDAATHLECVVLNEPIAEIALLTDGLQSLALHYHHRQAHAPFFRPMFQYLRACLEPGCSMSLNAALEQFLTSPAVNQRTHDDKTLILATRLRSPVIANAIAESAGTTSSSALVEPGATAVIETTAAVIVEASTDAAATVSIPDSEVFDTTDAVPARSDSATSDAFVQENSSDEAV
ncbi:MAG TPA: PP2C family serine/threonine-protein phosphatase [Candidatus Competibacter sp.]|nr:protein phosphatase 2C domain-containing protein [Candidatus Competibacter sp.]HRX62085.1 PP2C family serine/threonine-protein phosphatase [Candidatus Competibacter sp.]